VDLKTTEKYNKMSQEIVTFKLRRGTTSEWNAATTKLAQGEPGVDTTTGQLKIGNGSSSWNQLKTFYPATQPPANFVDETTPVNIGYEAGTTAGVGTIAIGSYAGSLKQGDLSIAMGYEAGRYNQKDGSVSIGIAAGQTGQGEYAIAVGIGAGRTDQGKKSVAVGFEAGNTGQEIGSVAIGYQAGNIGQETGSVAIGEQAGQNTQGQSSVAIGQQAGTSYQQTNSVAIGTQAGNIGQGAASVAIGNGAAQTGQGAASVSIGEYAGQTGQQSYSVAIGEYAGQNTQGAASVAIGNGAAQTGQGNVSIAIGNEAGQFTQGLASVAIGEQAGQISQQTYSVAIGTYAGQTNQGQNSIAIGLNAGYSDQAPNTIILNATGNPVSGVSGQTGSFYVAPIRGATSSYTLQYNPTTYEVTYGSGQHGGGASSGVTGTVQLSDGLGGFTGLENIYANTYGNLVLNTTLDLKTGSILDSSGKTGTTGQFLSSGVSGGKVEWIDTPTPSVLQYGLNSVNTNGITGDIDVIAGGLQGDINLIAKNGWVSLQSDFCSFTVGGNNGATRGSLIYTDATAISASSAELHVQSISDNSVLGSIGTAGQLLSAGTTGGSLIWIDAPTGGSGGTYPANINCTTLTATGGITCQTLGVTGAVYCGNITSNDTANQVELVGQTIRTYQLGGVTGQTLKLNDLQATGISVLTGADLQVGSTGLGTVYCGGLAAGTTASGSGTGIAANSVGGKIGMYSVTGQLKIQAEDVSNNNLPLYLNPAYGQTGEFSVFTGGDLVVGNSTGSTAGASGTMYAGSGQINQNFTQNPNQTPGYGASFGSLLQANGGLTVTGLLTASSIMASGSTGTANQLLSAGAAGGSLEWVNGINSGGNTYGSYFTIGNLLIQFGKVLSFDTNSGYGGLAIIFPTEFGSMGFVTATETGVGQPGAFSPRLYYSGTTGADFTVTNIGVYFYWFAIGTTP
jgi:Major tropism determinant N-terminal domain/Head domain of trimeric autotransporter adhesin